MGVPMRLGEPLSQLIYLRCDILVGKSRSRRHHDNEGYHCSGTINALAGWPPRSTRGRVMLLLQAWLRHTIIYSLLKTLTTHALSMSSLAICQPLIPRTHQSHPLLASS